MPGASWNPACQVPADPELYLRSLDNHSTFEYHSEGTDSHKEDPYEEDDREY